MITFRMMFHVIDDDEYVLSVLSGLLGQLGYESMCFSCPVAYIDYVQSDAFTLPCAAFTDINMPSLSGYELMDKIYQTHDAYPFVIVTANADIPEKYLNKAKGCLLKPFRCNDLATMVASLMQCERTVDLFAAA